MDKIIDKFLGKRIKDTVTGIEGICTGATKFLNGCVHLTLQPPLDKDGKMQKDCWFDYQQIELVEDEKEIAVKPAKTGGPQTSRPTHSLY